MKNISISVPDSEYNSLLHLLKSISFVKVQETDDFTIPEQHKEIVLERMKTATNSDFTDWDTVKKTLRFK
jgi:hypothetical protein